MHQDKTIFLTVHIEHKKRMYNMVKESMKKLLVGLAAFSYAATISASADTLSTSKNYFQPRAFSANLAREMLLEGFKHRDSDGWYGEFSADVAYQRNWYQGNENGSGQDVANGLGAFSFWSGTNSMTIGNNDGTSNVDVYQFGLGSATGTGSITLDPILYQTGADFMFVVGSSANESCFFAKIKAPLGVFNLNPNLEEVEVIPSVYTAGQLSLATSPTQPVVNDPAASMKQAFAGNLIGGQSSASGDFQQMQYGLINGNISSGTQFGDVEMTAGYRYISAKDNAFSVAVRAAAPTGGKPDGQYMIEPVFGRGGNWALGGYVDGRVSLWKGNNHNCLDLKVMANAMHLFSTNTIRSYDLTANGKGSKYLLIGSFPNSAYNSEVQNLINVSTLDSTSSFGVEGDAAIALTYVARCWSFDLGYEFWGRSAENLTISDDAVFAANTYAVLGRQAVGSTTAVGEDYPALNLCQPNATIYSSVPAQTSASGSVQLVSQSNQIKLTDFNVPAAQQDTALTSKVFSKLTYEWVDSNIRPHLGVMGELEISTSNNNALPQWAVALMGGVSF
jgi:hypothetical protein